MDRWRRVVAGLLFGTLSVVWYSAASGQAPADAPQSSAASGKSATARDPQLIADAERLLKLSLELQAEVNKSTKDTLSLSVIRKAEEVERLAKSVKERLKKEGAAK